MLFICYNFKHNFFDLYNQVQTLLVSFLEATPCVNYRSWGLSVGLRAVTIVFLHQISWSRFPHVLCVDTCLLYTSDAADDTPCVDLGGRRIIKKKKIKNQIKIQLQKN
eukprot:TRINITY_DN45931_c0_g1_i1.p3 TRINITY_DN45931_c0_g1~~TRINITY_DN45931_c0_g1_i1.p3  ORF type:complete len:108 (-),score=6.81 TRINITY_DN45931_c0_g1_i1:32-355(-)